VFLFACMLISSMQSLAFLNVQTIIVFRNLSTIAVAIAEKVVFGNNQSTMRMVSMFIIVIGASIYAAADFQFNFQGYMWLALNITATGAYSIMVKVTDSKVGLNSFGKVLYNNTLALPIVLIIVICTESPAESVNAFMDCTLKTKFFLLLSCLVGFFISVAGFLMQSAVNPTSFMIANNANKIVVVVLGMFLFQTTFVAGTAIGLIIALAGGALYSYDGIRGK
jgi:GDP-mannose transporter